MKIFQNAEKKVNTHVIFYDAIAVSKSVIKNDTPQSLPDSSLQLWT